MTAAPRRTIVAARGPEKAATRVHREAAELEAHTPQRLVEGYRAKAKAHVKTIPLHGWRHWRKWSDYTLPATLALLAVFLWRFPQLAIWPSWYFITGQVWHLGRLGSLLFLAAAGFTFTHFWHIGDHHTRRKSHRRTVRNARPVVTAVTPELIPIDWQPHQHKTVLVARLPHGTSVDDYRKQAPRLETKLRTPVTIRPAGPGKITVTQHIHDLLAQPIPRHQPLGLYNPETLWMGINRDGEPFYITISRDGSGYALLIAGAPDAGKSVLLNNILAQLVNRNDVQLWIVDPAEGADLGIWHNHSYRLATTPDTGIELFEELLEALQKRLTRMVADKLQKCPITADYPLLVLALDELPEFTQHENAKQRERAIQALRRLRRIGRKTNLVIIAATQDCDATVIPRSMSKLFSHRICLRVADYITADVVLKGARLGYGYDASKISPHHHGRGIAFDGADYTEFRAPAFYGSELREFVSNLDKPPVQSDLFVPSEWSNPVHLDTPWPAPPHDLTVTDDISDYVSNDDCDGALREAATRAGRHGVHLPTFVAETGFGKRRVGRAAHRLKLVDLQGRPGWWADREAV